MNKISVVVYQDCLPKKNNNPEKIQALQNFWRGVRSCGDNAVMLPGTTLVDCDVAVILGWVHSNSKNSKHLNLRRQVIDTQLAKNRHVVVIDSNLFLYKDTSNPNHYLRYSFNGVFPNTGIYCDSKPTQANWDQLSKKMQLELKPYRTHGNHLLVCLQRNGGWSMGGQSVSAWIDDTLAKIRQYSDRPVILRPHPGDKTIYDFSRHLKQFANVTVSSPSDSLIDNLRDCWAVINHNSSPAVAAAIEGFPIFLTDPDNSQCREIANTDFSLLENPDMPQRQAWLNRLAMFHWDFDDLRQGRCWEHMRKYL